MKNLLFTSLILITFGCGRKSVLFSNVDRSNTQKDIPVFFDELGNFYPDMSIAVDENKLKNSSSRLKEYFTETELKKINFSSFEEFQKSVVSQKAEEINKRFELENCSSVTFIMVGYNNTYDEAKPKLDILSKKINKCLLSKKQKTLIVPVFWDGKTAKICVDALSIFKNANANSYYTGMGLRLLVNELKTENIKMISHSLGANVISQFLMNQQTKLDTTGAARETYDSLMTMYEDSRYRTTNKKVTAGIIGPAIPGTSTFEDFYDRTSEIDKENDNYKVVIGYNENDKILKKFIKVFFSYRLSSTTLGCNYKSEVLEVVQQINNKIDCKSIYTIDFSNFRLSNGKLKKQRKHDIEEYMKLPQYDSFLEMMYSEKL